MVSDRWTTVLLVASALTSPWMVRAGETVGIADEPAELSPSDLDMPDAAPRPPPDAVRGRELYLRRCAVCHGADGHGDGPAARHLDPPPRDLTSGSYKLRSTSSGDLPTGRDIFRTLTRGIRTTAMPPWSGLPVADRWQLVYLLESLSDRFRAEEPGEIIGVPPPLPATPELIERGHQVYEAMKCGECHGPAGRGDGPAASTLHDISGRRTFPFDMTRGYKLKGGTEERDVYRTFHTGLDGTPMPSYHGILSDRDNWALVHYVRSLFVDQP